MQSINLPPLPTSSDELQEAFDAACERGDRDAVQRLLNAGADPQHEGSYGTYLAASNGHVDLALDLLPLSDDDAYENTLVLIVHSLQGPARLDAVRRVLALKPPNVNNNHGLVAAAMDGDVDLVVLMLPFYDPRDEASKALRRAAGEGHTEVVRCLMNFSDPEDFNQTLARACEKGHLEVVHLLLPVSDPTVDGHLCLYLAARNGHTAVVEVLVPLSDVQRTVSSALINQHWRALDELHPYLLVEQVQALSTQAPLDEMPKSRAFLTALDLAATLATPIPPSPERHKLAKVRL